MIDVWRGVISRQKVQAALRLLHVDILKRGLPGETLHQWVHTHHFFPHLNYNPQILALVDDLPVAWRQGQLCDPQILLQFPNVGPIPEVTFHTDQEPAWANGRRYARIVAVPLSSWQHDNGSLIVKDEPGNYRVVDMEPGDALKMSPDQLHSGGVNLAGDIRYGVYFRWLGG